MPDIVRTYIISATEGARPSMVWCAFINSLSHCVPCARIVSNSTTQPQISAYLYHCMYVLHSMNSNTPNDTLIHLFFNFKLIQIYGRCCVEMNDFYHKILNEKRNADLIERSSNQQNYTYTRFNCNWWIFRYINSPHIVYEMNSFNSIQIEHTNWFFIWNQCILGWYYLPIKMQQN